ncbi:carboxymuconolactone decarboxylase family protein [Paucibacter sp. O1-1]|nr:carboxymuconolactone decarboxylase family protein [Paucibacter sp. O1-1]MDA3825704.1 carboxymuconolactone decarboxylase family protein [Paucibacter sp. O1-1]
MILLHRSLLFSFALLTWMLAGAGSAAAGGSESQTPDPRVAKGEAVLRALNNGKGQPVFEAMRRDFPFLADATAGYALGDVWSRQGLDTRTRQLAAMAAFGALGLRPYFKTHAAYALNAGVPPDELKEIVYLITVPAGFPRAIEASQALQELFVERGITSKSSSR